MGIFAGQTGTYLHVPNLSEKRKSKKLSELALDAIRKGNSVVYGNHQNFEKLTIAFLDYFCQVAMNKKDPGLLRIMLHKGTNQDKILALIVSNLLAELQQHKVTMRFIELFHNCFIGNKPNVSQRLFVPKVYKPIFDDAATIAKSRDLDGENMVKIFNQQINSISNKLSSILYERLNNKISSLGEEHPFEMNDLNELIDKFEIPSDIRSLLGNKTTSRSRSGNMIVPDVSEFLDGLSFPFLATLIILGTNFTSAKVIYNNRELLKSFSKVIGKFKHPERLLWLTDTYNDKNGVSMFLQDVHKEIKKRNLPIDILVCSDDIEPDDHLIVVKPMIELKLPYNEHQTMKIPNFLEIHNLFLENEYDRIVCSTEGIMGLISLYLKNAYSVNAYFYMHTDWLMFARKVLKVDIHNLNRIRRFFRAYYKAFDGLFVLNTDQRKWLVSQEMGFKEDQVFLTAHWADKMFVPTPGSKKLLFNLSNENDILLFAGRLSKEKGVMEMPELYLKLKKRLPRLRIVFAGTGPAEKELKELIPDGIFLGWIDHKILPQVYSTADLLVLPSKFDTFSCVVLEALSCGLPVVAYRTKGPKDIVLDQENGYLVNNQNEMEYRIVEYFSDHEIRNSFKQRAIERSENYNSDKILQQFLSDIQLTPALQYEKIKA
jgi:glycosyltransferase involved in cell wall biosynthesis